MNLLTETIELMEQYSYSPKDITFIGSERTGHQCTWEEFLLLANHNYDSGFGGAEVATDLVIIFSDGSRMMRGEYDGSEWWDIVQPFKMPAEKKPIKSLFISDYSSSDLEEINK